MVYTALEVGEFKIKKKKEIDKFDRTNL